MQSELESDDEDAASDYSDDFEDAASSPAPKGKGISTSATISAGAKPTTTAPLNTTNTNTTAATAAANVYTGATLAEVKAAQDEASRGIRERERVLNPLKESLAYSLLASQVNFVVVRFFCHFFGLHSCCMDVRRQPSFSKIKHLYRTVLCLNLWIFLTPTGVIQEPVGVSPTSY